MDAEATEADGETMKIQALKPYAKLKDCVGQKLVAVVTPGSGSHRLNALLVFDGAWARLEVYGYDSDDGSRTVLRERAESLSSASSLADSEWGSSTLDEFVSLGLLDGAAVAEILTAAKAKNEADQERRERAEYDRLKKKFEEPK
jgi:hypothetical protein